MDDYFKLANELRKANQLFSAVAYYRKSISINPNNASVYNELGNTLLELGHMKSAVVSYKDAITINPKSSILYSNLGIALQGLKQLDDAIDAYDNAIMLDSNDAESYWNKSIALLLKGDFQQGLPLLEWRWQNRKLGNTIFPSSRPLWLGREEIVGKTILLRSEQGLGDTIQFCRYAIKVKELGATVILQVQDPLVELLKNIEGVDQIISSSQFPKYNFHCPLLSLPLAFNTTLESIPNSSPYIQIENSKIQVWKDRLGTQTKKRIGLAWSGSSIHINDKNRSISLAELVSYLPDNFEYVCLQKEIKPEEVDILINSRVKYFNQEIKDFTDTGALCELMDTVISVDTSVAHLSGALAKPTWVLLPYVPDWRWLLNSNTNPWYPSIKLFRQEEIHNWDIPLETIKNNLLLI